MRRWPLTAAVRVTGQGWMSKMTPNYYEDCHGALYVAVVWQALDSGKLKCVNVAYRYFPNGSAKRTQ